MGSVSTSDPQAVDLVLVADHQVSITWQLTDLLSLV